MPSKTSQNLSSRIIFFVAFFILALVSQAQNLRTDSLITAIQTTVNDSARCELYYALLVDLAYDNPREALEYGKEYLDLAQRVSIHEEISANNQLGIIYYNLGFLNKTIEHFSASIALLDSKKDAERMARMLNNMAIIYGEMGQVEKELEYHIKSLSRRIEVGVDTSRLSSVLGNIGETYLTMNKLDSARKYLLLSYSIDKENNDTTELIYSASSIGNYYKTIKNYTLAEQYYRSTEQMANALEGFSQPLCQNYISMGDMYQSMAEYGKAQESYGKAYELALRLDLINQLTSSCKGLALSHNALGDSKQSFEYMLKYAQLRDSVFTTDTKRQLESAEIQQKEQEILVLTQQGEIDTLKLQQSRLTTYSLVGVVFMLIVIAVVYYQKHSFKVRSLKIVERQRNEIAAKNRDILDSLMYARGIQEAMFPSENELKNIFKECFVFYKPSDLVTGDFYWLSKTDEGVLLAVVDCTGHGVPGAFMTVMANSMLNNIVHERGITSPSQILKELHVSIINTWHQNEESALYSNGLDAAICHINFNTAKVTYSGAKRPLYHSEGGVLNTYKGNCFSVGVPYYHTEIQYDEQEVTLNKGDFIYLFTDGIVDQFGGEANKKFLGKRLKLLLDKIHGKTAKQQQIHLRKEMEQWMAGTEQVDDMLLVGVKL